MVTLASFNQYKSQIPGTVIPELMDMGINLHKIHNFLLVYIIRIQTYSATSLNIQLNKQKLKKT